MCYVYVCLMRVLYDNIIIVKYNKINENEIYILIGIVVNCRIQNKNKNKIKMKEY